MSALRKLHIAHLGEAAPLAMRAERASDIAAREALLDGAFGPNRQLRTCQRLREGRARRSSRAVSRAAHPAGRDRAAMACQRRRRAGAAARAAGGRSRVPRLRARSCPDASGAGACLRARPWRRDPARRRFVLWSLRLLGIEDRRAVAAGSVRARAPARSRAAPGGARWRLGNDRAYRPDPHASQAASWRTHPQTGPSARLILARGFA